MPLEPQLDPAGQLTHALDPVALWNLPAVHATHDDDFMSAA